MGQPGQGEDSSAIEDIIYKLTGVRCKINGHRVALFFALLLFVFQVVAVQPGYDHWARIKKEVDHPIDCSELSCYEYDDYEVSYGLFVAREKFCADCDSEGSSSQCYWGTSCRRRQLYYTSGDEVDLDDDDLLDDVLSVERRLYGGWYGYDPDCCSNHYSEIDANEQIFCGSAARQYAQRIRYFCQDFLVITSQTRQRTYVSLLIAAAVLLGYGFNYCVMIRQQQQNPSPRVVAGLAALLTVGGVVGLAGTASYWETMVKLADDIQGYVRGHGYDKTDVCLWGCEMSLASSAIATFAGLAVVALEVKMNPEAFKRGPAKPTKPDDAPPALAPIATQKTEVKRQQTPVAKPESLAEPPAEAEERPGRAKNLFSYVFGSEAEGEIGQEPATEESVAIEMEPTTMREQEELEPEC